MIRHDCLEALRDGLRGEVASEILREVQVKSRCHDYLCCCARWSGKVEIGGEGWYAALRERAT